MGARARLLAVTAGRPRDVMATVAENGAPHAEQLVRAWFTGWSVLPLGTRALRQVTDPADDEVWVSSFDHSVVVSSGVHPGGAWHLGPGVPAERAWHVDLRFESSVGSLDLDVRGPEPDGPNRGVAIADEETHETNEAMSAGRLLPFEEPFWSGAHDFDWVDEGSEAARFSAYELGEEALRWLFGFTLQGQPLPDDLDGSRLPAHGFRVVKDEPSGSPAGTVRPGASSRSPRRWRMLQRSRGQRRLRRSDPRR